MSSNSLGASLALATAAFWAISPFCFASASRRIGSRAVAVIRAVLAAILLALLLWVKALFHAAPTPMPGSMVIWLTVISGIFGMGIGDLLGYEAFLIAGIQRTTLISTLAPVVSVICAWFAFGERMGMRELAGIGLVVAGTAFALGNRYDDHHSDVKPSPVGLLLAVGSAVCQGLGAVTLRWAYHYEPQMDTVLATTLRVASAAIFLVMLCPMMRCNVVDSARNAGAHAWSRIGMGTLVGPFGGMLCYVTALSFTSAGLVSALSSASPLFVLAIAGARFRKAPTPVALAAALVAVGGVVLLMVG